MQEIIEWLKHIEQLAYNMYMEASVIFEEDRDFSKFLDRLADDEALHVDIVGRASGYLLKNDIRIPLSISIDPNTRDHVEKPLIESYRLLKDHKQTKAGMIDCIVKAEFSEWNDIFLYVINTLKEHSRTFEYTAATIQSHISHIELFLDGLADEYQQSFDIRRLPPVWQKRLLVVEDEKPMLNLLKRILGRIGDVETAANGLEALQKTKEHFFDVIISDIDMPVMNGIEFFDKAVKADPDIASRVLFCSGIITPERKTFFEKNNLQYLSKPLGLDELEEAIDRITKQSL